MIKLLLQSIAAFIEGGYKKYRASEGRSTVVIYEIMNKNGIKFTRVDIFTRVPEER